MKFIILMLTRRDIALLWLQWHFVDVPKEILRAWKNFLLFNLRFFSISFLIKTFFSYWHKYRWGYGRGFSAGRYLEAFFSNLTSRIIGAIIRFCVIILGLLTEIMIFFAGIIVLFLWIFLPIIASIGLIAGVGLIYYGR